MQTEDLDRSLAGGSAFDDHYGLQIVECNAQRVRATLPVRRELLQPIGVVHGGVYASVAEAIASAGTNWAVTPDGNVGLGMNNTTSFLRPVGEGVLRAEATPLHRGRTTWVWDVEIRDGDDRACAVSRVTVAVRPQPAPES